MKRLLRALVILLLLLLAAGAAAFWAYRERALPVTAGTLSVHGPQAEIRIERDGDSIPTIHAASIADAAFGLGFVHAQDRLWQLETHRRIASGQLAEAFGAGALGNDKFLRALGVRRAAAAQWAALPPGPARQAVEAYSAGINAYLHQHLRARPPEFLILGLQPQEWTPVDTMGWALMMAWDLGGNWTSELLRLRLALKLPRERIDELLPPYPGDAPLVTADYPALYRGLGLDGKIGQQALADVPPSGIEGVGSNNWVVAGSHTASGKPLLANDPHLKLSAPPLWYFARIVAPGLEVAGATLPGTPLVVLGQNRDIAWGYTNTGPDVQDLYLERIDPNDPGRYRTPEGWATFETRQETIKVRGGADVTMTVRATRHGPVISDAGVADGLTGPAAKPGYAIAMRWLALDPDPGTVDASFAFMQAKSVDGFVAASAGYLAPMQNMVVADRAGHIGFVAAGRVPLRSPANDLKGYVPAPGWDARYDWVGWVPARETPREIDPPRGWIVTANQRIHGADYPHFLTAEWAEPWRAERIEQLLAATPKHDVDSLAAIQRDQLSLAAQPMLPMLRAARSTHPLAAAAQTALAGWNGEMSAESPAPAIFWAWVRQLTLAVFADELGPLAEGRSFRPGLEAALLRNDAWWCDDKATPAPETCADRSALALDRALDELQGKLGGEVSAWRWGRLHAMRAEHRPFSQVGTLARFFELRAPVGGDTYSVNVSRVSLRADPATGEFYLDEHGPSMRAVYDLDDPARSRFMHSGGQSGLPFAGGYRSFLRPWIEGRYVPVWAEGAPQAELVLAPDGRR